ncbi:hypothetical protein [Mucilaginibacter ginkgonis]|uniref:Uncharacterized protein n=1 Tax=Mucilaginibacter ginkgonis TaxID=2682091 RepID=A0A6I4I0T6_9SPHI|nr:hypothetical protein [Mucilaginibacter ginkgonis]QQL51097.1 hypothetical protein GO620_006505 [Mucilaginibacter ginkgonis]
MAVANYMIVHFFEDEKHDFNTLQIPPELLNPLANHLKWQYQKHLEAVTRHDFKMERAKQHDRYMEHCKQTQQDPKQIFIDFPVKQ